MENYDVSIEKNNEYGYSAVLLGAKFNIILSNNVKEFDKHFIVTRNDKEGLDGLIGIRDTPEEADTRAKNYAKDEFVNEIKERLSYLKMGLGEVVENMSERRNLQGKLDFSNTSNFLSSTKLLEK